jgi:hypothetical protein
VVLGLKGDSQELNLFAGRVGQPVPGLPRFDPNKMVRWFEMSVRSRLSPENVGPRHAEHRGPKGPPTRKRSRVDTDV